MKSEQAAFAERLRRLLAKKGIAASAKELEHLLLRYGKVSVAPQTVSGWLHGKFMPRLRNLRALAAVLDVDLFALQEDPKPRHVVSEPAPVWSSGLNGKDQLAIKEFAGLPERQRKLVRELIAALAADARRD